MSELPHRHHPRTTKVNANGLNIELPRKDWPEIIEVRKEDGNALRASLRKLEATRVYLQQFAKSFEDAELAADKLLDKGLDDFYTTFKSLQNDITRMQDPLETCETNIDELWSELEVMCGKFLDLKKSFRKLEWFCIYLVTMSVGVSLMALYMQVFG